MSLKVWLPLDGDLRNLGASNVEVTNNGATINNSGKIGSCYHFGTTTSSMSVSKEAMTSCTTECSVTFWLKIKTWNTSYATYFQAGLGGAPWTHYIFGFLRNATGNTACFTISNGSSASNAGYLTSTLELNKWYHIALTYKTGKCAIYLNGILDHEYSPYLVPAFSSITHITLGTCNNGTGYQTDCDMNDFRIYDHCLSAAEVHEISQGLLLHYKLDSQYVETSTFLNSTISSTAYNASSGKYGYNTTSNLTKTEGTFQGKQCIKVSTIEEGQDAQPYSYFSNLFTSDGTNAPAYKALSFDYFTTCPTTTWINFYKLGSGTGSVTWKVINSSGAKIGGYNNSGSISVKPNEWNHVEVVLHGTSTENAEWGYCVNGSKHTSNLDYYFLFANIQLEESDHVTGYGANLHNSIVTDSSGYGHDAQALNNPSISEDTPMYNSCIKLNGSNQAIKVLDNNWMVQGMRAMTINVWVKGSSYAGAHFFSCTESGGFNTEAGSSGYLRHPVHVYTNEAQTSTAYKYDSKEIEIAALSTTNWNMVTFVYDSTGTKTYINGELHHTYINTSYGIHFNKNARLFLGCEANTASPSTPYFNGSLSDFRLYVTALTPEDIKALYDVRARVDNLQNIHSYEFNETQSNIFRSELIMPFAKSGATTGIGEITNRNGEPAIVLRQPPFEQNLEDNKSGFLQGYFAPNTSYIFDIWEDTDDVMSQDNFVGGFMIDYTDGTSKATFVVQGGNKGFQHIQLITPATKSIDRLDVFGVPNVYYKVNSYICPVDALKIMKNGLFVTSNLSEDGNAALHESGIAHSNEFIET